MRKVFGLVALAAIALQPAVAAAAPAAKASVAQARQQSVQLALLQGQGQGQGQGQENSTKRPGQQEPVAGQSRRTTVLSRVLLFAPAAAVAGLLIALSRGGGRDTPISG